MEIRRFTYGVDVYRRAIVAAAAAAAAAATAAAAAAENAMTICGECIEGGVGGYSIKERKCKKTPQFRTFVCKRENASISSPSSFPFHA